MCDSRIRWLIFAHAVIGAAPLLGLGIQFSMQMLPLLWILTSLPLGSAMTLSIWLGLGRTRLLWRAGIGLAAIFYLSAFSFIADFTQGPPDQPISEQVMAYLSATGEIGILLFMLSGTFWLIGRRFEFARMNSDRIAGRGRLLQFSVRQVLVVMSSISVVLSLFRAARAATGHEPSAWETIAIYSFLFVTFLITTACVAFAALGAGEVKRNVAMVVVVAILLGVATAIAMQNQISNWWIFGGSMLIVITPMIVVLVSMLVVRSCGFRLVPRVRDAVSL